MSQTGASYCSLTKWGGVGEKSAGECLHSMHEYSPAILPLSDPSKYLQSANRHACLMFIITEDVRMTLINRLLSLTSYKGRVCSSSSL